VQESSTAEKRKRKVGFKRVALFPYKKTEGERGKKSSTERTAFPV